MDFFQDGQAIGSVASMIMNNNFTTQAMRPFVGEDGNTYIVDNQAPNKVRKISQNAEATLRKDEWIHLDKAVVAAARQRRGFVANLQRAGLVYNIGNALGKTVLQSQSASKRGSAKVSMDGLAKGDDDRTHFELEGVPLPLIHEDFSFSAREVATSRNDGTPLDTDGVSNATENVLDKIEDMHLGLNPYKFGGYNIYGLTSFPSNISVTITAPTAGGWTGKTLVADLLAMKEALRTKYMYGPFDVYFSPDWDLYLDQDYSDAKGDNTIRERIGKIEGMSIGQTLDHLPTGYHVYIVRRNTNTIRTISGLSLTTVRWETEGGMQLNYKVMAMMIPQLRADFDGNCGIAHGAPA